MIGWTALAITIVILAAIAWRVDDWGRDWTENTAQLSADAQNPWLRPQTLDGDVQEVEGKLRSWVDSKSDWQIEGDETVPAADGGGSRRLHLTRRTKLFRFVDDIHVTIVPDVGATSGDGAPANRCIVEAHSQSRLGKGDLGQNPRNLIELAKGLATADQSAK
ncbi:hypothetical protein CGZ80_13280 [Rhodopirellula sp. MGV]|nr:hypothetical protein CGZ80_13280 [Rhodopirellula sp. MGV]PNY38253.1 DUF1499 domain-containing protein [Rhodopirellula baltica]